MTNWVYPEFCPMSLNSIRDSTLLVLGVPICSPQCQTLSFCQELCLHSQPQENSYLDKNLQPWPWPCEWMPVPNPSPFNLYLFGLAPKGRIWILFYSLILLPYACSYEDSGQLEYFITIDKMSQNAGIFPWRSTRLSMGLMSVTVSPSGYLWCCVDVVFDVVLICEA